MEQTQKKLTVPEIILAILFGAMITIAGLGVFFRYILNSSLTWSIELLRVLFTWATFVGAVVALKDNAHIRIDLLIDKAPPTIRHILEIINHLLVLAFSITIVVLGFQLVRRTGNMVIPALWSLPINYLYYSALPVTFILGVYYAAQKLREGIKRQANLKGDKV
ncbi:MAG: TRAP transporter small permease [Lentisphaerae bacterium]|nr:TRAP transporter small permease [Lentisphaerota bacterium]